MYGFRLMPVRLMWASILAMVPAILSAAVGLTVMTPAAAAGAVEVSDNGTTFAATYPGALFDDIALLVPGDSQRQVFYVRNSGAETGFLRVTLTGVAFSDTDFADALTVTAHTAGQRGVAASLLAANPCWVLLEGQLVAPGTVVAVTADLALAQLRGKAGQGATAALAIGVELSDTTAGSLPPTECGSPSAEILVMPGAPGSAVSEQSAASGSVLGSRGSPGDGGAGARGDLPVLNLPGGVVIDPNTWRLYQELLVLALVAAAAFGSGWFMMVARRRRRKDADEEGEVVA